MSLEPDFASELDALLRRTDFALQYAADVSDTSVEAFTGRLDQIRKRITQQADMEHPGYIASKAAFLAEIRPMLDELLVLWPAFVAAAIESRGVLKDEGIRKEHERVVEEMKQQAADVLNAVEKKSNETIAAAGQLAKEIEDQPRKTATGISVGGGSEAVSEAQGAHETSSATHLVDEVGMKISQSPSAKT